MTTRSAGPPKTGWAKLISVCALQIGRTAPAGRRAGARRCVPWRNEPMVSTAPISGPDTNQTEQMETRNPELRRDHTRPRVNDLTDYRCSLVRIPYSGS
jgi:hypothetical protein